jgi:hypothetical protein
MEDVTRLKELLRRNTIAEGVYYGQILIDCEDLRAIKNILDKLESAMRQMDLDYIDENYVPKEKCNKIRAENEHLRDLYWRTARRLSENGKVELADYMLAQINAVPTFVPM